MTADRMRAYRLANGLCRICGEPDNKTSQLCTKHRKKQNAYSRRRRSIKRVQASPDKRCELCLGLGHTYGWCPLNADRYR